jgi:MFS family permease
MIGRGIAPVWLVVTMVGIGALALWAYARHADQNEDAILDLKLLRIPTFYSGVIGGLIFRIGIGAMPFLLPLLLQIGFGLTPFASGSLTFATAAGALMMKFTAPTLLRWFGFRRTLVVNCLISGAFLAACALFTPSTPHWLLLLTLLTGGFFRSLQFTALNAISYADIDLPRMSRATSFASVSQQMSGAIGVAVAAICVQSVQLGFGDPELQARDLSLSFVMVAIISSLSFFVFAKLKPDAGAAVSGKIATAQEAQPAAAE